MSKQKYMNWEKDLIERPSEGVQIIKRFVGGRIMGEWLTFVVHSYESTFLHGHKYIKLFQMGGVNPQEVKIMREDFNYKKFVHVATVLYNGGKQK